MTLLKHQITKAALLPINHWGITLLKFLGPLKKISGDSLSRSACIRCQSARQVLKGETMIFAVLYNCKSATNMRLNPDILNDPPTLIKHK